MTELAFKTEHPRIRACTPDDLAWMIDVANDRYPDQFNAEQASLWGAARMKSEMMIFLRGDYSFGVSHLARKFNAPDRFQAYLTLLYSKRTNHLNLEPFRVAQALVEWAKYKGATAFWFSDITGTDLGHFATRLGGQLAGHTYRIDLDGKGTPYG